jgi:hypothetical protein
MQQRAAIGKSDSSLNALMAQVLHLQLIITAVAAKKAPQAGQPKRLLQQEEEGAIANPWRCYSSVKRVHQVLPG